MMTTQNHKVRTYTLQKSVLSDDHCVATKWTMSSIKKH